MKEDINLQLSFMLSIFRWTSIQHVWILDVLNYSSSHEDQQHETMSCKFLSYLPTPLLGQDMTQGQFLSGV